ncbi:MAG: hypothetical protein GKR94_30170 [Gammaproteobacteria bacterium]|nr:hypothetical protein [Gammaproteobacteria bacterium]
MDHGGYRWHPLRHRSFITGGKPLARPEGLIDGFPVRVPMVDVNAIGAGGGRIAWLDQAGGLRVGPHSAGADPGPACYGRGGEQVTVTDAAVVLGLLNPAYFAAGKLQPDPASAREVIRTGHRRAPGDEDRDSGIGHSPSAQCAEGRGDPHGVHQTRIRSARFHPGGTGWRRSSARRGLGRGTRHGHRLGAPLSRRVVRRWPARRSGGTRRGHRLSHGSGQGLAG